MSQPTLSAASSEGGSPERASSERADGAAQEGARLVARTYAVCALCIATASVFFLTGVAPLPVLLYFPLSRRFSFVPRLTELSMDFYGRSLLALLAGLAAALSTYAVMRIFSSAPKSAPSKAGEMDAPKSPKKPVLLLLTGYAATALVFAVTLYAYLLATRVPTPLPLPSASTGAPGAGQSQPAATLNAPSPASPASPATNDDSEE